METELAKLKQQSQSSADSKRKEVTNPISFYGWQKQEDGSLVELTVIDEYFAGKEIPAGVDPQIYMEEALEDIKKQGNSGVNNSKKVASVVRAEEEKEAEKKVISIKDIVNYELSPRKFYIYMNFRGEIRYDMNEVLTDISIDGIGEPPITIKISQINNLTRVVANRYPHAIVYDRKNVSNVENDFRKKLRHAEKVMCYIDAGWQVILGKYQYIHSESDIKGAEIRTQLTLPCMKEMTVKQLPSIWNTMKGLYKEYIGSTILSIYSILGVLYRPFSEAGYPPHFLLFITGKSGSFKTTIAKLLFIQLCDEQYRNSPRRIITDTEVSIERGIVTYGRDTITLLDDFSPARNKHSAIEMSNKLESVIRMVGDGSSKSRSNTSLEDIRGEGVSGMVVLTGELHGKGLSSNLRCLFCEIESANVDLQKVSYLQKQPYQVTTFIYHFARFLSTQWKQTVEFIKGSFESYRGDIEKVISARRLVDTAVTYWIAIDIIQQFLTQYCGCEMASLLLESQNMKQDIIVGVKRSELIASDDDPALIFMKTLLMLIDMREISICNGKPQKAVEAQVFNGFRDDEYTYINPHDAYMKVVQWMHQGGQEWSLDEAQVGALLCKENYAIASSNGASKKTYYARVAIEGRKCPYLKIANYTFDQLRKADI